MNRLEIKKAADELCQVINNYISQDEYHYQDVGDRDALKEIMATKKLLKSRQKKLLALLYKDENISSRAKSPLNNIDWPMLARQKSDLLYLLDEHCSTPFAESLIGIINILDAMQDYAVDALRKNEFDVFDQREGKI